MSKVGGRSHLCNGAMLRMFHMIGVGERAGSDRAPISPRSYPPAISREKTRPPQWLVLAAVFAGCLVAANPAVTLSALPMLRGFAPRLCLHCAQRVWSGKTPTGQGPIPQLRAAVGSTDKGLHDSRCAVTLFPLFFPYQIGIRKHEMPLDNMRSSVTITE